MRTKPRGLAWRSVLLGLGTAALAVAAIAGSPATYAGASGNSVSPAQAGNCILSDAEGGTLLTTGLGDGQAETLVVKQGEGATLSGALRGPAGGISGALVCIYGTVITEAEGTLLGIAVTGQDGSFTFALGPGPSRDITAVYRTSQGEISAGALLQTRAVPTLRLHSTTIHNSNFAHFSGEIPGPNNDGVMVVLQVKRGKGWMVFHRYSTRNGGRFAMRYRFTRTFVPTIYTMRAQVLGGPLYPYLTGNSPPVALRVLPR